MLPLLKTFSWQELRHHPWRNATALFAVTLGVALAFSVHLINQSALGEFASAVSATGGQPDLELRGAQGRLDESVYARMATHDGVAIASPVLELSTFLVLPDGTRRALRVVGVDVLVAASLSPGLVPVPSTADDRFAMFLPDTVFLNPAARQLAGEATKVRLQSGLATREARIAGTIGAGGPPVAVMDIGAAQDFFGRQGDLTRIDIRLAPGTAREAFTRSLSAIPGLVAVQPGDTVQRVGNLSRAYRVNLTVLALVALFTGAFLVYSVLSLSVARRSQQFALLGVLGLTARERRALVLAESMVVGVFGSLLGIALGTSLAGLGLRLLGGDLGGGYFPGVAPELQWSTPAAIGYAALGTLAAAVGGWLPARAAQRMPLALTLKGLGSGMHAGKGPAWVSIALLGAAGACALLPSVAGLPLGAYLSVGLLLVGGITALPAAVALVYDRAAPLFTRRPLALLAIERARRVRETAAVAVSGVVAALSLAVALTVMVASFRDSVTRWLDVVLPADLYVRTAVSSAAADTAWLPPELVRSAGDVPGVRKVAAQRTRTLLLDPARPAVALLARDLGEGVEALPVIGTLAPVPAGAIPIYVSEAMVDLFGAARGRYFDAMPGALGTPSQRFFVAGVWRDYVRQTGTIAISRSDYQRLTGDQRANELQLWLLPGTDASQVQQRLRDLARRDGGEPLLDFASAQELRKVTLRIFDRSFAVTYWLQAVAIGIGLFGVAASFGAQVLARRKEFGLLAHLGLTRGEILGVVAGEGAAWTLIGSAAGLVLGLAVAVVLVHVVNPQSFHWTMDMLVPWVRLLALCAAVVTAGTATAWIAGRAAAGRDAVLAVKEDW